MDLACHEGWIPLATVNPVALKIGFQPSRTPYVFYTLHVFLKKGGNMSVVAHLGPYDKSHIIHTH